MLYSPLKVFFLACFLGFFVFPTSCKTTNISLLKRERFYSELDKYQRISAHREALEKYFSIDRNSIKMFASPKDKAANIVEYEFFFGTEGRPGPKRFLDLKPTKAKPFNGLRIALDPGHVGGQEGTEFEEIEGRYVWYPKGTVYPDKEIRFNEGNLTYATALLLKEKLEEGGAADVLVTRRDYGISAMDDTFYGWLGTQDKVTGKWMSDDGNLSRFEKHIQTLPVDAAEWWRNESNTQMKFSKLYNRLDLQRRVEMINSFDPHVALDLHYNAGHPGRNENGTNKETIENNYSMVFVPGSFMKGELSKKEYRIDFLRILVTEDLDYSSSLADNIVKALDTHARVRPVGNGDVSAGFASYIPKSCAATDFGGVYARNLLLTRKVQVPFCYLEPLCQENDAECRKLAQKDFMVAGKKMPNRIKEVVDAYILGLASYVAEVGN